ncbi:unnamed protein product [Calicophoron daubneyi]|uniref:N-acetylgalactosaminide beta-1,3-galactosyltransferase n=1 Tax=Calicophoron daubneyi TaxID=300641 RepID=A0AAV2THS2_CALDB
MVLKLSSRLSVPISHHFPRVSPRRFTFFILGLFVGLLFWNILDRKELLINRTCSKHAVSPSVQSKKHSDVSKSRILCMVNTHAKNYESKAVHVHNTWGRKCSKVIYTSGKKHRKLPILPIRALGRERREKLWRKLRLVLWIVHKNWLDSFDYFYRCDDDTYTMVENLRVVLEESSPTDAFIMGYRWNLSIPSGYFSGGAGYIISQSALRTIVERGFSHPKCPCDDYYADDYYISICANAVGIHFREALDRDGRRPLFYWNNIKYYFTEYPPDLNGTENERSHIFWEQVSWN